MHIELFVHRKDKKSVRFEEEKNTSRNNKEENKRHSKGKEEKKERRKKVKKNKYLPTNRFNCKSYTSIYVIDPSSKAEVSKKSHKKDASDKGQNEVREKGF